MKGQTRPREVVSDFFWNRLESLFPVPQLVRHQVKERVPELCEVRWCIIH